MKKRVLILSSSPRRHGNSDTLCDEFLRGAREAGHDAEKIFLRDRTIYYCTGCGTCTEPGRSCPQYDDAREIIEKMVEADVIVLASPVYFYAMSAQMKTLIDRCCSEYLRMSNKEFYFIITAAEQDKGAMERVIEGFRGFLDCLEEARERTRSTDSASGRCTRSTDIPPCTKPTRRDANSDPPRRQPPQTTTKVPT